MKTTPGGLANGKIQPGRPAANRWAARRGTDDRGSAAQRWSVLPSTRFFSEAPPVRPFLFRRTQTFDHRVVPYVTPLLLRLSLGANPVIKVIILPAHTLQPGCSALPVPYHDRHAGLARKRQECVRMVWHQQKQFTPPAAGRMIVGHRLQEIWRQIDRYETGLLIRRHSQSHMKQSAVSHPARGGVVQSLRIFQHTPRLARYCGLQAP